MGVVRGGAVIVWLVCNGQLASRSCGGVPILDPCWWKRDNSSQVVGMELGNLIVILVVISSKFHLASYRNCDKVLPHTLSSLASKSKTDTPTSPVCECGKGLCLLDYKHSLQSYMLKEQTRILSASIIMHSQTLDLKTRESVF